MKKNFTNINTVLGHILEKHKLSHLFFLESIKQNWVAFDKTIAAHARPVEYDEKMKKLTLKIDNASWKKEFILNKDLLRVKIQNTFRDIEIKNVEIV